MQEQQTDTETKPNELPKEFSADQIDNIARFICYRGLTTPAWSFSKANPIVPYDELPEQVRQAYRSVVTEVFMGTDHEIEKARQK